MALAQFRKVQRQAGGEGRLVVSEGIAPSEYLLPHEHLPTLFTDLEDDRFETVITKGTIVTAVAAPDGTGDTRLAPCNGVPFNGTTANANDHTHAGDGEGNQLVVVEDSKPIGVAQYNLHRPFDKGTSQGAGWVTRGYIEHPIVQAVNDNLAPGDLLRSDNIGRPVKCTEAEARESPWAVVGRVVAIETFASNFDDGLLSYMQLPSDPGALKEVFELTKTGPNQGRLGIRANLNVDNVVGAFRWTLNL